MTTQGDIVYRDGSGLQRLAAGTSGQVLQTGGSGANPSWTTVSTEVVNTTMNAFQKAVNAGDRRQNPYHWSAYDTAVTVTDANNYFDLSQVQLEVGDNATDFEHLGYGEELALCQRYYWQSSDIRFFNYGGAGQVHCTTSNPVQMRTTPTLVWYPSVADLNNKTNNGQCTKDGVGNVAVSTLQSNSQHTSAYVTSGQGSNHRVARTCDAEI